MNWGNIELYELGHMFSTIQCHIHASSTCREGPAFRRCGICLRPDEATTGRIHARFQTLIVPYCFARINRPKGKKCCESQWPQHQWKVVDATRGAHKRGHDTITIRWQRDDKYRNSQLAHGRTEEYCRYLDYLTTIDISYAATWEQRHRYESTITLSCDTQDGQEGPMNTRTGFQSHYARRTTEFYTRQRPFDEELRAKLEWMSQNWRTHFAQPSSSSSSSQTWWQHEHEHQDTQ